MLIGVAIAFWPTVNDAAVVVGGVAVTKRVSLAWIDKPPGSVTRYVNELVPERFAVGLNWSPISCAMLTVSPGVTGVTPSARNTAPVLGRLIILELSCAAE